MPPVNATVRTRRRTSATRLSRRFVSELDKAVKKGIITKNTANRKKSRAQLRVNKMAAKAAEAK